MGNGGEMKAMPQSLLPTYVYLWFTYYFIPYESVESSPGEMQTSIFHSERTHSAALHFHTMARASEKCFFREEQRRCFRIFSFLSFSLLFLARVSATRCSPFVLTVSILTILHKAQASSLIRERSARDETQSSEEEQAGNYLNSGF